ncbi:MAG: histidine kinase [Bacteroidota bacterium]
MKFFHTGAERKEILGFDDRWAIILGVPLLAAVANTLFLGQIQADSFEEYLTCYAIALAFTIIYWTVGCFIVIQLRKRMPGQEETPKRLLWTLVALTVATIIISTVGSSLLGYLLPPDESDIGQPSLAFKIIMSFTLVIMVISIYESIYFFVMFKRTALERERLAKENMQAQLSVLKQQMNPHFLFNSLNTLVNIIPEDTEKATLFTQRLAAVYRRILEYRHKELISLQEELISLKDYIFLMQTRFEDKLNIEWCLSARTRVQCGGKPKEAEVPPHLRFHRIVPLSVQLLVENAIKHNVVSQDKPLTIKITLDETSVTVSNKLNLRNRRLSSTGWGHQNLSKRYAAITDQPVDIQQTEDFFTVSVPVLEPSLATRSVDYARSGA